MNDPLPLPRRPSTVCCLDNRRCGSISCDEYMVGNDLEQAEAARDESSPN